MRRENRFQKLLYLIMAALVIYILYKSCQIFADSRAAHRFMDSGSVQRTLEDAAVRTYAAGYTAAVEERKKEKWISGWMRQISPVYSYLSEGQALNNISTNDDGMKNGYPSTKVDASKSGDADKANIIDTGTNAEPDTDSDTNTGTNTEPDTDSMRSVPAVSNEILAQLSDFDYFLTNYYTVDGGTSADAELLDAKNLLACDLTLKKDSSVPQILIYHTHSQEAFADSKEGETAESIVGMGEVLAGQLRSKYGYNVIHDTGVYDLVDGVLDRSAAYDYARDSVEKILEENPTIEVVVDLHRDGVEGKKFVTEIGGKPTSMIMFFNGISRNNQEEPLYWLENPYIEQNLAFSLQLELKARAKYPGFTRNIYLKAERFNLHLRPRSLLVEAGTQLNTVEEEKNAMEPLADLLNQVLSGK